MEQRYGLMDSQPDEMELAHRALARQAAAEGFVLLKNNGALPLKSRKLALYGMGARKTVKGGLGSGSVEERYSVNIEDGLKNAGFEITTQSWLDDYDAEYAAAYRTFHDMVEEKIAGLTNPMEIIPLAHSFVFRYPSGRIITPEDIAASDTDTAVFVLMRQAGEGNDRKLEQGDYFITDIETENLQLLAERYAHTVLIVNVGGLIDFSFLDEIPGIDAVVLFVQGGEEGGNALADVLSGRISFSGKLADTVPLRYEDIPFGMEYSHLNGDLKNEYHREGIYVGYRYFDAFGRQVRFPFGFGLSYTDFTVLPVNVSLSGQQVLLDAAVTNIGGVSGREVAQAYLSVPGSGEYQRLVAFSKTGEIAPGGSAVVRLAFDMADAAVYDEEKAAWVLPAGDYILRVGNSSRNTAPAAVIRLGQSVITRQCRSCCSCTDVPDELKADFAIPEITGIPVLTLSPDSIGTEAVSYSEPEFAETAEETRILDSLSAAQQAELLLGGELQQPPRGAMEIHGAAGKTATALIPEGIRNVVFSDGPAGINIVSRVRLLPGGDFAPAEIPERYNWGALGKGLQAMLARNDGPIIHRYATAWPVEMLLAQTWNPELVEQIGRAVGAEQVRFGITVWLAPGMNIHRNPLCGRTFEYFSEDPVLTGRLAAALVRGVQSCPGAGTSVKHFCCNNTEDNRNGISANVSERALREIYLKGFEIAVKQAQPATVMTSYNLLNHVYTANRHDLLTDILRCEWGFRGVVMTDWGSTGARAGVPELCAPAGNDLIMPGNPFDRERIKQAVSDGTLAPGIIRRSAGRVLRLVLGGVTPALIPSDSDSEAGTTK